MPYDDVITNPRWRTNAIFKIVFGYISAPYWPINAKFRTEMKTCQYMTRDQSCNFPKNPRWRTAAILEIALSPYPSNELSDFDQIWYTGANFHSEDGNLTKIEIFQIQDGGRTQFWKSFFGYISSPYWPINAKFGMEMKNHMQI